MFLQHLRQDQSIPLHVVEGLLAITFLLFFLGIKGQITSYPTYCLLLLVISSSTIRHQLREVLRRSRIVQLGAIFHVFVLSSILWSDDISLVSGLKKALEIALVFSFFASVALIVYRGNVLRLYFCVIGASVIGAALMYYDYVYNRDLYRFPWVTINGFLFTTCTLPEYADPPQGYHQIVGCRRWYWSAHFVTGALSNPVVAASSFGLAWSLVCAALFKTNRTTIVAAGFLSMFVLWALIFLTASMGVYLGFVAILCYLMTRSKPTLAAIVAAVGIASLAVLLPGELSILPRGLSYRDQIWADVLNRVIPESLWFGTGIGTASGSSISDSDLAYQHPHNILLSAFFHVGIAGVALIFSLLLRSVFVLYELDKTSAPVAGIPFVFATGIFLVDGSLEFDKINYIWMLFWLPIGAVAGMEARSLFRKENNSMPKNTSSQDV